MVSGTFSRLIVRRLWKTGISLAMSAEDLLIIVALLAVALIS